MHFMYFHQGLLLGFKICNSQFFSYLNRAYIPLSTFTPDTLRVSQSQDSAGLPLGFFRSLAIFEYLISQYVVVPSCGV